MSALERTMPIPWDRRVALLFLGPPVLWGAHFVIVYVYVSLACLWGWDEGAGLLGPIRLGVAAATLLAGLLILGLGVRSWRDRKEDAAAEGARRPFLASLGVLSCGLFLAATLFVGLPTLMAPTCH